MFRKIGLLLLPAVLLPNVVLGERAPEVIKRTGKWVVSYDPDGCHLLAEFGTGDAMTVMRLSWYEPGDQFDFSLYGKRVDANAVYKDARIDFGLKDKPVDAHGVLGNAGKVDAIFFNSQRLDGWKGEKFDEEPPKVTPEQEARVTGVTVAIAGKRPFRLDTGPLDKPFAQIRHCSANLVKSWGYDPQVQAGLSRPVRPKTSPQTWLSSGDFPSSALAKGHNGIVQFRFDVDAEGKIADCFILSHTSPDDFADLTCKLVRRRAKLSPALDAKGVPVRSYYVQKVNWMAGRH